MFQDFNQQSEISNQQFCGWVPTADSNAPCGDSKHPSCPTERRIGPQVVSDFGALHRRDQSI